MTNGNYTDRCAQVKTLIDTKHRLGLAYTAVQQLVKNYPDRAEGWFLYNLIVCLGNYKGGARKSYGLIQQMMECNDCTPIMEGDAQRDRMIGLIRYRRAGDLESAQELATVIRKLHAGNGNRLACLTGVLGRLAFARQQYDAAIDLHEQAERMWKNVSNPDLGWVYLNRVQLLRAVVAAYGTLSPRAQGLAEQIREAVPKGHRSRAREAMVLTTPGGLKLYRFLEQHR